MTQMTQRMTRMNAKNDSDGEIETTSKHDDKHEHDEPHTLLSYCD